MHVLITHLCAWGDDADNDASIAGWKLFPSHYWIPDLQLLRLQDERIAIQYTYFTYIVTTTFLPTRSKRLRVLCWNDLMGEWEWVWSLAIFWSSWLDLVENIVNFVNIMISLRTCKWGLKMVHVLCHVRCTDPLQKLRYNPRRILDLSLSSMIACK